VGSYNSWRHNKEISASFPRMQPWGNTLWIPSGHPPWCQHEGQTPVPKSFDVQPLKLIGYTQNFTLSSSTDKMENSTAKLLLIPGWVAGKKWFVGDTAKPKPSDHPSLQHWSGARSRAALPWLNQHRTGCGSWLSTSTLYLTLLDESDYRLPDPTNSVESACSSCSVLQCHSASLFNSERTSGVRTPPNKAENQENIKYVRAPVVCIV